MNWNQHMLACPSRVRCVLAAAVCPPNACLCTLGNSSRGWNLCLLLPGDMSFVPPEGEGDADGNWTPPSQRSGSCTEFTVKARWSLNLQWPHFAVFAGLCNGFYCVSQLVSTEFHNPFCSTSQAILQHRKRRACLPICRFYRFHSQPSAPSGPWWAEHSRCVVAAH